MAKRDVAERAANRQQEATVRRWQASGLSQREFCMREGLPEWKLSDWKKMVFRADAKNRDSGVGASGHTRFAPVTVVVQEGLKPSPISLADRCDVGLEVIVFKLPAGSGASIIREVVEAVVSKC